MPVDFSGRVFMEYRYKLDEMMRGIDLHGIADEDIAWLAYETFL